MSDGVALAELTTIRLGGPAERLVKAVTEEQLIETVAQADAAGEPLLVLGAGSNMVVADAGVGGAVIRIATRGVSSSSVDGRVRLAVAAGESWAELVGRTTAERLAGIECLAGIPGTAGATPIQNVGAYGQQVSETIVSVRAYDRDARAVVELDGDECGFAYRSSRFRASARFVVLAVTLELERAALARPLRHQELARTLGVATGARAPLTEVGAAVLTLRRGKGMVLDSDDPDSVSVGSFFVNPILSAERYAELEWRAAERLGPRLSPPAWPEADGRVKTSAAWLIEQAGFRRGYGTGRVGISTKHTLALVNRGGATTGELLALAREIRGGVQRSFGVTLTPEPMLVGVEL
ncbi:MAG: UDP-N-acetylmuramate dehydrogenase [Acidobacteriota bacterium]|nr:UDP-N-acetylmuramate dehydrogenase [Acidobacteriota bacterium]